MVGQLHRHPPRRPCPVGRVPSGLLGHKRQEFIDLRQGGRSIYDYSKTFNQLAPYVTEQVDTNEKKKDCFMRGLLTKLQKRLALSTGGTFLEFVSNAIIADDAIRAHKETKKRKVVVAPSGSTPPKYRMVYPPRPIYQPHQHQH
jgi:hypothetical protein